MMPPRMTISRDRLADGGAVVPVNGCPRVTLIAANRTVKNRTVKNRTVKNRFVGKRTVMNRHAAAARALNAVVAIEIVAIEIVAIEIEAVELVAIGIVAIGIVAIGIVAIRIVAIRPRCLQHAQIPIRMKFQPVVVVDLGERNRLLVTMSQGREAAVRGQIVTTKTAPATSRRIALPRVSTSRYRPVAMGTTMRLAHARGVGDVGDEGVAVVTAIPEANRRRSKIAAKSRALTTITKMMSRPR